MDAVPHFSNHRELRALAKRRLPRFLFDYVERGTEDEAGVLRNRAAFEQTMLNPRVMIDVSHRDLSTTIFGRTWSMPLAIAPAASGAMLRYRGEAALAAAAARVGIPYCVSGASSIPIETAVAAGGITWFQLYAFDDFALTSETVARAEAAGAEALVITADSPVPPIREYNVRNGFALPFRVTPTNLFDLLLHPRWALMVALRYAFGPGLPRFENWPQMLRTSVAGRAGSATTSARFDWTAFAEVRRHWRRPLLIKGIMTPEDAKLAVNHGADGIIVSNHGGRNLDSASATLAALPPIADAVGEKTVVLLDGGIRRGSDILKAIALGARAVLCGRLPLFAVAAGGEPYVQQLFTMLRLELDTTLALVGGTSISGEDATRAGWIASPPASTAA